MVVQSVATIHVDNLSLVRSTVQEILDAVTADFNTSISFGYADASGSIGLVSGIQNIWNGEKMKLDTRIPVGSIAKTFTALSILQHVEAGDLRLDENAATYIDPVLNRLNGTSLGYFFGDYLSKELTIDHLLTLRSGIRDYDDERLKQWTLNHPNQDIDPFQFLWDLDKSLVCTVGSCAYYSSINYILLGFVLMEVENIENWEELDLMRVFPKEYLSRYEHTFFAGKGQCSKYANISHQFSSDQSIKSRKLMYKDMYDDSCLNGWVCGNAVSTGKELANLYFDSLISDEDVFLKNGSSLLMDDMTRLSNNWCPTCFYGRGIFTMEDEFWPLNPLISRHSLQIYGHPGLDWGSSATLCGANLKYKFSICLAYSSVIGMNCEMGEWNTLMQPIANCKVYDAVMKAVGGPRLLCPNLKSHGDELEKQSAVSRDYSCEWM